MYLISFYAVPLSRSPLRGSSDKENTARRYLVSKEHNIDVSKSRRSLVAIGRFKDTSWNAESRPAWQASASKASDTCHARPVLQLASAGGSACNMWPCSLETCGQHPLGQLPTTESARGEDLLAECSALCKRQAVDAKSAPYHHGSTNTMNPQPHR